MVKRFIICCDGTWNSSDAGKDNIPSNVALLSRMIARQGYRKGYSKEAREALEKNGASDEELALWDVKATIEQVVYYQTGVGTGPSEGWIAWAEAHIEGATGSGLEEHVLQAYHFIATNYQEGDEVLLFGFSRGAYTARAVGGLLTQMGILQPLDLHHFNNLYRCYKEQADGLTYSPCNIEGIRWEKHVVEEKTIKEASKKATKKSTNAEVVWDRGPYWHEHIAVDPGSDLEKEANKDGAKYWTPCIPPSEKKTKTGKPVVLAKKPTKIYLEVIGVWDTVGALGVPENQLTKFVKLNEGKDFADTKLNKYVRRAYQALALDEHRGAFTPSLWYIEDAEKSSDDLSLQVDLRQCWFPGFHSDIGGGDETDEKFVKDKFAHKIDQLSLAWMCDQVERERCLTFEKDVAYAFVPNSHTGEGWKWKVRGQTDPISNFYSTPVGGGSVYRCPGTYPLKTKAETTTKKNATEPKKIAPNQHTREKMHPSIHLLMEATKNPEKGCRSYKPAALGKSPIYTMTGWGASTLLEWKYEPQKEGMGAKWIRPAIPAQKAGWISSEVVGSKAIEIAEHVIMSTEDETHHNFEARLLTALVKEQLGRQNKIIREKYQEAWERKLWMAAKEAEREPVMGPHPCHEDWWFDNEEEHQKGHHDHDEHEKAEKLKAGVLVDVVEIDEDED